MYNNVSEQFATTIRSPSRTFNLRLKINGKWIDAGFKKMSYETASTSDEGIQIGSAVAAKIELTVKRINELFENTEIPIDEDVIPRPTTSTWRGRCRILQ